MKKLYILPLILIACLAASGQKASDGPKFIDMADLAKKQETAAWLVEYDYVAWQTTDVLLQQDKKELERLGEEWFCFRDKDGSWHAVYGRLVDKTYEPVLHFGMDANGKIAKSAGKLDQLFLDTHARALALGRAKLFASIPAGSPKFNQYIRQNADKTFSVWLLPAFQPNRVAVFGGEGIYTIDATATRILKDESYFQKSFRGFKTEPPRKIKIDYPELKQPTLGTIFFAWYYREYFTEIMIDNSESSTFLMKVNGKHLWTTVEKEKSKIDKPN
jgi:hypothetical protein